MNDQDPRRELTHLMRAVATPRRVNPLVALYRWRYEVVAAVAVPTAVAELNAAVGPIWSLLTTLALASMLWHWPAARRFCRARLRSILIQHRLRTAFARARLCTVDGRLPAILWTVPKDDVVTVWVNCPAGLDPDSVAAAHEMLAAACFATEVTTTRHERRANLVSLAVRTDLPQRA